MTLTYLYNFFKPILTGIAILFLVLFVLNEIASVSLFPFIKKVSADYEKNTHYENHTIERIEKGGLFGDITIGLLDNNIEVQVPITAKENDTMQCRYYKDDQNECRQVLRTFK
jgi:hypothetical protein